MPRIPNRLQDHKRQPKLAWPSDCMVQWGETGMVFGADSMDKAFGADTLEGTLVEMKKGFLYTTAFFEAFPKEPLDTFIRGEGESLDEAEQKCWEEYEKQLNCPNHEYERGKYRGGHGKCKHCDHFKSDVFESLDHCRICGAGTRHEQDINDEWICKKCSPTLPKEKWGKTRHQIEALHLRVQENEDG